MSWRNLRSRPPARKNLAAQHPDEVKDRKQLFVEVARKHQVFPIDASAPPA
jgi:hypothetical protein